MNDLPMSSVEQRARNRLADAYDLRGWKDEANALRSGMPMDSPTVAALDTIAAALREQPEARGGLSNPWTGEPRDYRDVNSDPDGVLCVEPGAPLKAAPERSGPTVKQAWWAGYRAGKGLPHDTHRQAALRDQAELDALTAAQQQGQAVALDRMLGAPAYPDARTDPFNGLFTKPQPMQQGGGEVIQRHVVTKYRDGSVHVADVTAPPSAPVGVEQETERVKNLRAIATEAEHLSEAAARACDDVEKEHQACRAIAARNLITQQPAKAEPGWKLVPVEPTDGMLTAYYEADRRRAPCTSGWRAMLAAAPTPPGDDAAGGGHG